MVAGLLALHRWPAAVRGALPQLGGWLLPGAADPREAQLLRVGGLEGWGWGG